jgi:hypothetical protein
MYIIEMYAVDFYLLARSLYNAPRPRARALRQTTRLTFRNLPLYSTSAYYAPPDADVNTLPFSQVLTFVNRPYADVEKM